MHALSATFVSLLAILPLVLSTPIPVWSSTVVNKPAVNDADSKARVAAYHEADATAKDMVSKMVTVANSGKPEHQKIVNDAFGPIANRNKIKATIHNLNTQQVRVRTTDVVGINHDLVATTPVTRPNGPTGPIKLGPNFFAADSSKEYRAGTLIHEATHQQSHTGDLINNKDRIVGTLEDQKNDIKMQPNGRPHVGYHYPGDAEPKKVPTSEADLSVKYKQNRDNVVQNMEDNADSYRVFAHLCSQPGVVPRDIELFNRALLEADADDHFYLAKRDSCALPKDYFKNKAAAKAATADNGTKSLKPGSHLTKGGNKQDSRLASLKHTSQKGASDMKSHVSTKSTKPISAQTKVNGVTQKKAAAAPLKKSTPNAAPKKKAGKK